LALTLSAGLACAAMDSAHGEVRFNSYFLHSDAGQQTVDLSHFAAGNFVLPGKRLVDLYVNQESVDRRDIDFVSAAENQSATACVTKRMLNELGVVVEAFPALAAKSDDDCIDVPATIPDATLAYDDGQQRLDISIPQASIRRSARGNVPPSEWDDGIAAGLLDYNFSASNGQGRDQGSQQNYYLNLRSGVNVGAWRLRNYSTFNRFSGAGDGRSNFDVISTYAERDIRALRGRVRLGDSYTSGNVFESTQFRGVQLSSDESMLPDSLRGYAPVVRGIAQTNAKVEIRQNGYVVYTTVVPPGPFVISDLYPASSSGDLEVTVTEADGRQTQFRQPFSAVPNMLREGASRYQFTMGQARSGSLGGAKPYFLQASYAYGVRGGFTPYTGVTLSDIYQAAVIGAGKNMGDLGAVSFDVTHARTKQRDGATIQGQSWRFLYAKALMQTGTDFRLLGYRYSTAGYRDFNEAMREGDAFFWDYHRKARVEGTVTQNLGKAGSVYLTASQQSYWSGRNSDLTLQLGYNGNYQRLSYGVYVSQARDQGGRRSHQITATLSMPLDGSGRNARLPTANLMIGRDSQGAINAQAGVSGSLLENGNLYYSAYAGRQGSQGAQGSFSGSYQGSQGKIDAGYSYGSGYRQASLGLAGGAVVHGGGVTLSQPLQDTLVLVEAKGTRDVGVENQTGVATDRRGYAVIPYANAYRRNRVALDTEQLGDDVDLKTGALEVVPTHGAVVKARFETLTGRRVLLKAQRQDGSLLPIGAKVIDAEGKERGIVGPDSQIFLAGVEPRDMFKVATGQDEADACSLTVPDFQPQATMGFASATAVCTGMPHAMAPAGQANEATE
jgi:outer membrane usher protein